jgi:hypothetical protein
VSNIPGVNTFWEKVKPDLYNGRDVAGAPWQLDWRDSYPVGPDEIHNHTTPTFLGILDGTESVTDWNPWEGVTGPHPNTVIRYGYGPPGLQEFGNDAPLAIDSFDRHPDHGQATLSGVSSIAALVPFIELPDYGQSIDPSAISGLVRDDAALPYHFDPGLQIDMGQAIGPRQIFRSPPSYSDQTAAFYAAGF